MDFELKAEQKALRDKARQFAETVIKPRAAELDAKCEYPADIIRELGEQKMMSMVVPVEYGGGGMDNVSYVLALMAVSKACASTAAIMFVNNSLYCFPLVAFATDPQRMKYLYPCATGDKTGCWALTEIDAGSDVMNQQSTGVKDGHEWVINGRKKFVTNGSASSFGIVVAVTENEQGVKDMGMFVVDLSKTPGFRMGRLEEKLGILAASATEMLFENARVPEDALLGKRGEGIRQVMRVLQEGWVGVAAQAVGIGRAILEEALEYAKRRKQFGKPVFSFQPIQWKLADMAMELDAAELLTLRAAWLEDRNKPFEKEAAMAKMYASDVTMRASIEGMQVMGGYGYCREYPMERHMRDAKICQIYQGTSEMMQWVVAGHLVREKRGTS